MPELPPPRDRVATRRRRRRGWRSVLRPEYLLLAACGMAAFLYIFTPVLLRWWQPEANWLAPLDTVTSDIRLRAMQTFTIAWLFFFGASIGSFLNVVIYRSPRGKTLLGPSRCPRCQQKIRARHNIPVLGWLMLRGRCYDCRLPISARYPLVEAVIGSVFLSLAAGELFTGGANLPVREPNYYTGIGMIVFDPQWDLIAIYAVHAVLVSVLISWGLIQYDGQRIPLGYFLLIGMALLTLVTLFPAAHPVPWNYQLDEIPHVPLRFNGLVAGLVGLAVGGIAGLAFALAMRRGPQPLEATRRARGREQVFAVALVGLALGWHAIASMALLTAVLRAIHVAIGPESAQQQARLLPMAAAVWSGILVWRPLSGWSWWPAPERSWLYHLLSLSLAAVLSAMTSSGASWTREEAAEPEGGELESGQQPASDAAEIED